MKTRRIIFGAVILFCLLTTGAAQAMNPYMEAWGGYGAMPPDCPAAWQPHPPQVYGPYYKPYPYYQPYDPNDIHHVANQSTDPAKVIDAYPISTGHKNTRRIAHINARRLKGIDAYSAYADLAVSYEGDYLASYRAGDMARRLGDSGGARAWFERALSINPYYKPALDALGRLR